MKKPKKRPAMPNHLAAICACCHKGCAPQCPNCSAHQTDEGATARKYGQTPDLSLDVVIAPVGYQADLYLGGKNVQIECRDFSGAPRKGKALELLIRELDAALERWRTRL